MEALTREQVREVDRKAIEELGIPGVVLMENAGRHAADIVMDVLENDMHLVAPDARVAVFCGSGNNGGDGYVVARHLHNIGVNVDAIAVKDVNTLTGDAAINCDVATKMGLVVNYDNLENKEGKEHVLVDALLGTGFQGDIRDDLVSVINLINQSRQRGAKVVAIDVPSGLDCDTGQPSNATIEADVTVTFVAMKQGFLAETAEKYVGQAIVVDIGAPPELLPM